MRQLAMAGLLLISSWTATMADDLTLCRTGKGEPQLAACATVGANPAAPTGQRVESLLRHSTLVHKTGDDSLALAALEAAFAIDPKNGDTAIALAKFYYDNAQYDVAASHIQRAQQLLPSRPEPRNIMGKIWMMKDDLPKALEEFKAAIALAPAHANSRWNCANVYFKLGRYSDALDQYAAAAKLYPEGGQRTNALAMAATVRQKLAQGQ